MKQHRFEIVQRGNDRYSWRFVVEGRRRRRVLARGARTYRSPEKVTRAINKLKSATIADQTDKPFPLPETSFRIVSGVVPLMVEEHPVEDDSREVHEHRAPVATKVAPKAAAARKRKPAARRTASPQKAT
jgi:hypothetical protein